MYYLREQWNVRQTELPISLQPEPDERAHRQAAAKNYLRPKPAVTSRVLLIRYLKIYPMRGRSINGSGRRETHGWNNEPDRRQP